MADGGEAGGVVLGGEEDGGVVDMVGKWGERGGNEGVEASAEGADRAAP